MSAHHPSKLWRGELQDVLENMAESPEWAESVEIQGGAKRMADLGATWSSRDAIMSIYLGRYRGDDAEFGEAELRIRELRDAIVSDLQDLASELSRLAWEKRLAYEKAEREQAWKEAME